MIIHDKMVEVIRNALVDYESATGLECQIRYADRLSAKVEMALEVAEAVPDVIQINQPVVTPYVTYTTEPQAEKQTETKSTESNLYQQIIKMRTNGKSPAVIAKELGISKLNVYDHLKFEREQEAK